MSGVVHVLAVVMHVKGPHSNGTLQPVTCSTCFSAPLRGWGGSGTGLFFLAWGGSAAGLLNGSGGSGTGLLSLWGFFSGASFLSGFSFSFLTFSLASCLMASLTLALAILASSAAASSSVSSVMVAEGMPVCRPVGGVVAWVGPSWVSSSTPSSSPRVFMILSSSMNDLQQNPLSYQSCFYLFMTNAIN